MLLFRFLGNMLYVQFLPTLWSVQSNSKLVFSNRLLLLSILQKSWNVPARRASLEEAVKTWSVDTSAIVHQAMKEITARNVSAPCLFCLKAWAFISCHYILQTCDVFSLTCNHCNENNKKKKIRWQSSLIPNSTVKFPNSFCWRAKRFWIILTVWTKEHFNIRPGVWY